MINADATAGCVELLQDRERKRGSLAGACLGEADHVTAGQDGRERLVLDGSRLGVAERVDARLEARAESEMCECH
jgi:hypothetical protein